jgi:hypothetical protein
MISLVGNHTRKNSRVSCGPDHALADLRTPGETGFWIVEDPMVIKLEFRGQTIEFAALPYIDPPAFDEIISTYCPRLARYDPAQPLAFVLAHQEINGSQPTQTSTSNCQANWPDHWPPMISGHLHQRHAVRNCLWVGTPMQHSLNETPEKYIYFGILTMPTSSNHSWVRNGNYSSSCGELEEIQMEDVPTRHKMRVEIEKLHTIIGKIKQNPLNYYTITVIYNNPADILKSQTYNELRLYPRVTIITEENASSEKIKVIPSNVSDNFQEHLKKVCANNPEIYCLLSSFGGW